MQENILEPNPDANLAVYVVWEPMLGGKRHHAVDAVDLIDDPRVTHFWNDRFFAGEYFRKDNFGRIAWDIYFLFSSEAIWENRPEPIISSGITVYHFRSQLERDLAFLLEND